MSDDTRRVLDLLAQGKITVDEADQLLKAVGTAQGQAAAAEAPSGSDAGDPARPRWIRINVHKPASAQRKDVNIRVPLSIVKGGMRLGAIIAPLAGERVAARLRERGIDVDLTKLDGPAFETMLQELGEMNIEVDNGKEQVRITCE